MLKLDPRKNLSSAGKFSSKKYYYLIDHSAKLDKILKNKPRKRIVPEDFLHKEDSIDDSSKDDSKNIFSDDFQNKRQKLKKEQKEKNLNNQNISCPLHEECENGDIRYKHHIIHHNMNVQQEKDNLNKINSKIFCLEPIPNKEFTYKKIVYSNSFNKMLGREDTKIKIILKDDKKLKIKQKNLSQKTKIKKHDKKLIKGLSMSKQISRCDIPSHYDVRIKTAKMKKYKILSPLLSGKSNKSRITFNSNNNINKNNILVSMEIPNYKRNFSSLTPNKKISSNDISNNNISNDIPANKNCTISFSKMLSRKYVDKVRSPKMVSLCQNLNPDYTSVDAKNYGDIKYKNFKKPLTPSFNGLRGELIYNVRMNYNNHLNSPQYVNFAKMIGRESEITDEFPVFMNNLYSRNAINSMSEKSLKMNNYINGRLKRQVSSFNDRKSFNIRIKNGNISQNSDNNNSIDRNKKSLKRLDNYNNNIEKIFKKMILDNITENEKNSNNKLIDIKKNVILSNKINKIYKNIFKDYYKLNFDYLEKDDNFFKENAIDGITFKKINSKKV